MSERGIEIHNGEVVFPEGMPQTIHLGTEASPLTQGEAGQIVISAVIDATAIGGDILGGYFGAEATETRTGDVHGLRALGGIAASASGIVVTGHVRGLFVHTTMDALAEIVSSSYQWEGIRVNMYAEATSVMNAPIYGIHVNNYITSAPLSNYYFMRFSENGGVTVEALAYVSVGGVGDITNLFVLAAEHTAWGALGDKTGIGTNGFIAVNVAGFQKYIQLYG